MKLSINQSILNEKMSIVQRAISSRAIVPELEGVLLEAEEGSLSLTTSDSEIISIKTSADCNIIEEGKSLVNARIFADIVRRLPNDIINIEVTDNKMHISCLRSNFELITLDHREFPTLPIMDSGPKISIGSKVLKNAIRQTSFAVSQDLNRMTLTGVLFEIKDQEIRFVSLDGYRLSVLKEEIDYQGEYEAIVPGSALNELERILSDDEEENVKISFSRNNVCFDMYDTVFYSQLIEGNYFNYEDIIREDHASVVSLNRMDLKSALERASLLARAEKANLIKLTFSDNNCLIESNTEIGSVEENVSCQIEGVDQVIAFNSRYLLEGIKNMDDETIKLQLLDDVNPLIIEGIDNDKYLYLVLPVRLA